MNTICVKYRLYPSKSQQTKINSMLETCRQVYNSMLLSRKVSWETEQKSLSRYEQQNMLPVWKDSIDVDGNMIFPELKEVYAHTLQDVANRVDRAYKAFFRRVKNGETPGYPRYKGHNSYNSLTYTENVGFSVGEDYIRFSKIGNIKAIISRSLPGNSRQCILCKQGNDYYACVSVEVEKELLPETQEIVALDMGLEKFAVLSNGEIIDNPRFFRKQENRLAKSQKNLSKDKKNKTKKKTVSNIYKKVRNQRNNFIHQESRKIINNFGIIILEDLNVKNMSKRPAPKQDEETKEYLPNGASSKSGLNKSILDAAWTMFRNSLKQKAKRAMNRRVIEVNPAYTSQDCYICGYRAKKKLSDRWHYCPNCNASLDRDLNAARNILTLGTQRIDVKS